MSEVDYYIVIADRYQQYRSVIDLELMVAFFLDIPVVVLQPWSCWSVHENLQRQAWKIINWDAMIIALTLKLRLLTREQV